MVARGTGWRAGTGLSDQVVAQRGRLNLMAAAAAHGISTTSIRTARLITGVSLLRLGRIMLA